MAKIATTIEESKKLMELGLSLETADMKWYYWKDEIDAPKVPTLGFNKAAFDSYKNTQAIYLPCWSLSALMEIVENTFGKDFSYQEGEWRIIVWDTWNGYTTHYFEELVNLVAWALEDGCLKNE